MCKLSHPAVLITHLQSTLLEYSLFDSSWYLRCPTQIHSVVAKEALNTFNLKIVKASMQRRRNGKVDFQQENKFFVEKAANGVRIVAQFPCVCWRGIVTAVNNTTMKSLDKLPITRKASKSTQLQRYNYSDNLDIVESCKGDKNPPICYVYHHIYPSLHNHNVSDTMTGENSPVYLECSSK